MELKVENLILANGRVLLEKTEYRRVYKVAKVAKNANYCGLQKQIVIGDLVLCNEYLYNDFKIGDNVYYIIKPTSIAGFFEQ